MASTTEYKILKKRIAELRNHFIPFNCSKLFLFTDLQEDQARAYRLLIHAEIENYLETCVANIVNKHLSNWKKSKSFSKTLFCLIVKYNKSIFLIKNASYKATKDIITSSVLIQQTILDDLIQKAVNAHIDTVRKNNNGIKEKNLISILEPIGIALINLDPIWLGDMNTFGSLRGNVAHKAKAVAGRINPKDELSRVVSLMNGIKKLDDIFSRLLR
jgi:hypothetical protein